MTNQDSRGEYYDVEKYRRVLSQTVKVRKGIWKFLGRITAALDSIQGFFVAFLPIAIVYGFILAVVVGAYFGPLVFLGIMASIIGGLTFAAEKSVGKSLQFVDVSMWKKTVGVSLAFVLALGLLLFILNLNLLNRL